MAKDKKTVPVTSVTPKVKTEKVSEAQKDRTRKLVGAIAVNLIPGGKVSKEVAKFASKQVAKKMVGTEGKTVVRKFAQNAKTKIVEQTPKKFNEGPKSPVKGTKFEVERKTKGQSPLQVATFTTGKTVRETGKKATTIAKTATNTAYAMDKKQEAQKSKKKK